MRRKVEYTHNGSVWKSLWLLIRSLINIAAFGAFWISLAYGNITYIIISTVVMTAMVMLNFVFPVIKK